MLGERLHLVVPSAAHDLVIETVALRGPLSDIGRTTVSLRQLDRPIQGDPALEPAVGKVLATAAGLPHALVGLVPVIGHPIYDLGHRQPATVRDGHAGLVTLVDRVHRLTVDVELQLVGSAVADAHWP